MMRRASVALAIAILAVVFIAAAVPKIMQPHEFALAIYRHQLTPGGAINLMAVYLPWLEVTAALGLFLPRLRAAAAVWTALMLVLFTGAIGINLWRGLDIACGCFTLKPGADHMGWLNLVRNGTLLALTAFVWWDARRPARQAARR